MRTIERRDGEQIEEAKNEADPGGLGGDFDEGSRVAEEAKFGDGQGDDGEGEVHRGAGEGDEGVVAAGMVEAAEVDGDGAAPADDETGETGTGGGEE